MCVINQNRKIRSRQKHPLHPPGNAAKSLQRAADHLRRNSHFQRADRSLGTVLHRKNATDRTFDLHAQTAGKQPVTHAFQPAGHIRDRIVRTKRCRTGDPAAGHSRRVIKAPAIRIGSVDNARLTVPEQTGLGPKVVLHIPVHIQMLRAEIGKDPDTKTDRIHLAQRKGMRADLHHHMCRTLLPHARKHAEKLSGIRGCHIRKRVIRMYRKFSRRRSHTGRADQSARNVALAQDGIQHMCHRGLAVGSRHAHHSQCPFGMPVKGGAQPRKCFSRIAHP
ncbi:unknown [Clostridium sp. CAG:448]|nr:unknown [Clostridium sp. CAG:448]